MGKVVTGVDIRYALGRENVTTRAIKVLCPYHDDTSPSMAVYADGTKCFACGATETPDVFLRRVGVDGSTLPSVNYDTQRRSRTSSTPYNPGAELLTQVEIYHALLMDEDSPRRDKIQWFQDRGIFYHTILRRKLGHTGTCFTIPVWYGDTITGIRFRLDEEYATPEKIKQMKYFPPAGQPILLYRPAPRQGTPIITEGELDALVLSQYGFDAITTTGGNLSLHKFLTPERLKMETITVAVDMDEGGDRAYENLCEVWKQELPRLPMPDGMDVTNYILSIPSLDKRRILENKMEELWDK